LDVPEFGVGLVAALTGVDPVAAEDALDELVAVRLVDVVAEGRFKIHDLLRLYAAELAEQDFPPDDRKQALDRALDWYLQSFRAVVDGTEGLAWFESELPCLVSAAIQASAAGSRFVVDLLAAVRPLALKRGCWHELEVLSRLAHDVGARLDDVPGQSLAIATLATVDWRAGRIDEARTGLQRGLELARAASALEYEVRAQHNLGWLAMRLGDNESALEHMTTAVELLGDRQDHAIIGFLRHNQAEVLLRLGRSQEALDCFDLSLAARRARGDRIGESVTLAGLGRAYCLLDWQDQAMSTLEAAARRCQEVGNQEDEWEILLCRSEIRLRQGSPSHALADLDRAAELAATVDDEYGQAVVARQLARTLAAHGDHAGAVSVRRRAENLFAAPGIRRDPVLEKLLTTASR
jgi:tetratricopeptide (TPR) repeat protein